MKKRTETTFNPGEVERNIIAYTVRGIQIRIYDWASMSLGRESQRSAQFKDEVREIMKQVRQKAYDMIDDYLLNGSPSQPVGDTPAPQVPAPDVIGSITHFLPAQPDSSMLFWDRFLKLVRFTYGKDAASAEQFYITKLTDLINERVRYVSDKFDEVWSDSELWIKDNRR